MNIGGILFILNKLNSMYNHNIIGDIDFIIKILNDAKIVISNAKQITPVDYYHFLKAVGSFQNSIYKLENNIN